MACFRTEAKNSDNAGHVETCIKLTKRISSLSSLCLAVLTLVSAKLFFPKLYDTWSPSAASVT